MVAEGGTYIMSFSTSDAITLMQIRHDLFGIITGYLEPTFLDASNNYLVHHEPANAIPREIFYSFDENINQLQCIQLH